MLNLGVSGYSTRDEALVLQHVGLRWKPRVVIVGYVLNDPETVPRQELSLYFSTPEWWHTSHLLRGVAKVKHGADVWRLGGGDYSRFLHAPNRKHWQSVLDAFRHMRELTKPLKIPVLVVLFPRISWDTPWEDYAYTDIHQQIAEAAKRSGLDCLDLFDAYSRYSAQEMALSEDNGHPTEHAHAVAASAIRAHLGGLLGTL